MRFRHRGRSILAVLASCCVLAAGPVPAQTTPTASPAPADCYLLNDYRTFLHRLNSRAGSRTSARIHIVHRDDSLGSGTIGDWQKSIESSLKRWTSVLPGNGALPGLDGVSFSFSSETTAPDNAARRDADLIVVVQNLNDAQGLFTPDEPRCKPENGYAGFLGHRDLNPPVVMLFPSKMGWKANRRPDRVRSTLLTHEFGHLFGLRDLYEFEPVRNDPTRKVKVHKALFKDCHAIMYGWEDGPNLQAGDKAGAKKAYDSLMGSAPIRNGFGPGSIEDEPFEIPADADIPPEAGPGVPGVAGGFILDGYGGITPFGGAILNTAGAPYWPNWDIARALVVLSDRSGGWVLDGWGGVHEFGRAPSLGVRALFPNWDMARDLVVVPKPGGGYMGWIVDGWGGLHAFNGAPSPQVRGVAPYHAGQDSTVSLVVDFTGTNGINVTTPSSQPSGGYVLERSGLIRRFGLYGSPIDYHYTDGRFPILNPALGWKKLALAGTGWYVVGPPDPALGYRYLRIQSIGTPWPMAPVPNPWGAFDIVRDVVPDLPVTTCTSATPYCLQ